MFCQAALIGTPNINILNTLIISYATEVIGISALSASIGVTLTGVAGFLGMLLVLFPQRIGLSSFMTQGVLVLGLGIGLLVIAVAKNEVSRPTIS